MGARKRKPTPDEVDAMSYPMECLRCHRVHDAADVEVTGRYSDCTMWTCPNCGATIDDRPRGWGGSAVRVDPREYRVDSEHYSDWLFGVDRSYRGL